MPSEAECRRLLDNVCVYTDRQSHPEIRSFKQIQITVNARPKFHSATQHTPKFLSIDRRAARPFGRDDVFQERGVIRYGV